MVDNFDDNVDCCIDCDGDCCAVCCSSPEDEACCSSSKAAGLALFVAGAVVGAGVVLLLVNRQAVAARAVPVASSAWNRSRDFAAAKLSRS